MRARLVCTCKTIGYKLGIVLAVHLNRSCHCEPLRPQACTERNRRSRLLVRSSAHTGVAPSRDSLRSQSVSPKPSPPGKVARASPASARRMRALASPYGRGAPQGRRGRFYPLSRLRRQLPQSGSQGGRGGTDCHVGRWPPRNDIHDTIEPGRTGGLPHQSADWFAMTCVFSAYAGTECRNIRQNWKRFSEVPKKERGGL